MAGLTGAILVVYLGSYALGHSTEQARTAAFATWLLGHVVLALNLKQTDRPVLEQGLLANNLALGWMVGMVALVLAMTLWPSVRTVINTPPEWGAMDHGGGRRGGGEFLDGGAQVGAAAQAVADVTPAGYSKGLS